MIDLRQILYKAHLMSANRDISVIQLDHF